MKLMQKPLLIGSHSFYMFIKLACRALVYLCLLLYWVQPSQAAHSVTIEPDGFGVGVIEVVSDDGVKWTSIKTSEIIVTVKLYAGISSGYLRFLELNQGTEQIWRKSYKVGDWASDGPPSTTETVTATASTENMGIDALLAVEKCNSLGSVNEQREFFHSLQFNAIAHFSTTNDQDYPEYYGYGGVSTKVICKPIAGAPSDDLQVEEQPFKTKYIKLFLTTVNGVNTDGSNPSNRCPALKITTRVETNKPGQVDIKLWRESKGKITSEIQSVFSKFDAEKNGHFADVVKWEKFKKTTPLQYKAEVLGTPFAPQTGWQDITVHCTGAGGGGLAQPTEPSNYNVWFTDLKYNMIDNGKCPRQVWETITFRTSGPGKIPFIVKHSGGLVIHRGEAQAILRDGEFKAVVQRTFPMSEADMELNAIPEGFESAQSGWKNLKIECKDPETPSASGELTDTQSQKITGDFQFLDNSGKSQCPRKVRGVINFQLKKKENVHYSLDCNSGSHPSGVIQPTASSNGGFIAPALVSVDLKPGKNGKSKLTCALKARENGVMTLKKVKARDFSCKKFVSGTVVEGLTSGSNNQSSGTSPPKPQIVVCKGGKIRGGKCTCGSKRTLKKLGKKKFQCVAKPVRANPDKQKKAKLICKGGKVRKGKCTCGSKRTLKKLGKKKFQCVAKPVRANPDKPKKAKLICKGGKVRKGKCACGSKRKLKKLGKRKFQCVSKPVRTNPGKPKKAKLVCKGGKIKGGRCKCGKKRILKKTGNRKFICFKPQQ